MAGRFLSIEEAAQRLGVSIDEVNRLVDRKKLFPMRDGTTLKFKADDVERVAGHLGEESSRFDGLSLDLDASGGSGGSGPGEPPPPALSGIAVDDIELDDIVLDDQQDAGSIFADDPRPASSSPSQTIAPGLSMPAIGSGVSAADVLFDDAGPPDSEELSLESIVGASSPSLAGRPMPSDAGTVAIDLGSAPLGSTSGLSGGSLAIGSGPGLAAGSGATGTGGALSGVLDSGLSLEDGDVALSGIGGSGIDLGSASGVEAAADGATLLGGDDFELGGLGGDDESASVVIASEESGDSSFFTETMGGAGSSFSDESAQSSIASSSGSIDYPHELAFDIRFSIWQIMGLVCCTLMLLVGGFVAIDLVRTLGSPAGTIMANPLLDALAEAFGWR
jgi:excisionase family DNA binding protein